MAYIDVLPLADAKTYLRLDDSLADDDAQITRMIKSALSYIEKQTNIYVYARNKTYFLDDDNFVRVYDFPINSVVTADYDRRDRAMFSNFILTGEDTSLVLNIGYANPADVPSDLIDIALQYIKYLYYEAETNENNKGMMPIWLDQMLYSHKRFII
jgi:hypothetical protein